MWYQQDGAKCQTTEMIRNWLAGKFGARVISGKTDRPWPAKSPDLSPCDYWLWSICLQEIRKVKPRQLIELQELVSDFCFSLSSDEVRKATAHVLRRTEICLELGGGHFEHMLKKSSKNVNEE